MKIQEAIKSGRPFKRPDHVVYILQENNILVWDTSDKPVASFGPSIDDLCTEDLLAEDWELQEETVSLTRSELDQMFESATRQDMRNDNDRYAEYCNIAGVDPFLHLNKHIEELKK